MAKKSKGNLLESLLRYEIILALFALIGLYYFLTFSPVRMPRQAITSPSIDFPSSPPTDASEKKTAVKDNRAVKVKPTPPDMAAPQNNQSVSASRPAEAQNHPLVSDGKKPAEAKAEPSPPPTTHPPTGVKEIAPPQRPATVPTPAMTETKTTVQQQLAKPATKPVEKQPLLLPPKAVKKTTAEIPTQAAAKQKAPTTVKQHEDIKHAAPSRKPAAGKLTSTTPGKKAYVIQVGIFIFQDTLKQYQQILKKHGYTSFVTTRKRLLPMHRVFVGPYPDMKTARQTIKTIKKWGDDPFPCRRGKSYYINVGSFYYQTTAVEKVTQYRSRGFTPVTFHEPVNVPHHILLVDGFSFDHYPRHALRSIQQLGIPDAFVRNWQP